MDLRRWMLGGALPPSGDHLSVSEVAEHVRARAIERSQNAAATAPPVSDIPQRTRSYEESLLRAPHPGSVQAVSGVMYRERACPGVDGKCVALSVSGGPGMALVECPAMTEYHDLITTGVHAWTEPQPCVLCSRMLVNRAAIVVSLDEAATPLVQTFRNTIDPTDPESYPPGTAWDLTNSEIVEPVVRLELGDYAWTEDARGQWYIKQTIQTQVPPALIALCKRHAD